MADGLLESLWSQLLYAKKDTQPSQPCPGGYTLSALAPSVICDVTSAGLFFALDLILVAP